MRTAYDVVIVGAGIIGASLAAALVKKRKNHSVAVVEKEGTAAQHTSGRNSGVVHAGFNLKPGSLKARFCIEGNERLRAFCLQYNIPFQPVGTVVVARDHHEVRILEELHLRGRANGVPSIRLIDTAGIHQLEPAVQGVAALHAPSGAITSGRLVTQRLVQAAGENGCQFLFNHRVRSIEANGQGYALRTPADTLHCRYLVNCAGLYADEVAHEVGVGLGYTIIPFRGEYYRLRPEKSGLVRSMVYPVPNLAYPFLGVHWTRTITGEVIVGPNATIALGRESYHPWQIRPRETTTMLTRRNFWNLLRSKEFRRLAWQQVRLSWSKGAFIREAQRLIPEVTPCDFVRGASGNRAQVVDSQGRLIEDMLIEQRSNALHVLNAVSPGMTCAIPFAEYLVESYL